MFTDIIAIDKLEEHRNGVDADSFYSCIATVKGYKRTDKDFLITFDTDEQDINVIVRSCRVIKLSDVTARWRGDDFARWLNSYFREVRKHSNKNTISDFIDTTAAVSV